jgi:hypothetical protein
MDSIETAGSSDPPMTNEERFEATSTTASAAG